MKIALLLSAVFCAAVATWLIVEGEPLAFILAPLNVAISVYNFGVYLKT